MDRIKLAAGIAAATAVLTLGLTTPASANPWPQAHYIQICIHEKQCRWWVFNPVTHQWVATFPFRR